MIQFPATTPNSDIVAAETSDSATIRRAKNSKTGYQPVNQLASTTAAKGRRTFVFWTLVALLFTLAVGNLIVTLIIANVLRVGKGLESVEVISDQCTVKFFGQTDLGHIYKRDGKLEGFHQWPVDVLARNGTVSLNVAQRYTRPINKVKLERNFTFIKNTDEFRVANKQNEIIYSTEQPVFRNLRNTKGLTSKVIETNRIASGSEHKLKIEGKVVTLKGAEGTRIEGKQILWNSDQDIYLKSMNGAILLSGREGVFIDVDRIPIAMTKFSSYNSGEYKVCVCMPKGKLFRIPIPTNGNATVYCNQINMSPQYNPCM